MDQWWNTACCIRSCFIQRCLTASRWFKAAVPPRTPQKVVLVCPEPENLTNLTTDNSTNSTTEIYSEMTFEQCIYFGRFWSNERKIIYIYIWNIDLLWLALLLFFEQLRIKAPLALIRAFYDFSSAERLQKHEDRGQEVQQRQTRTVNPEWCSSDASVQRCWKLFAWEHDGAWTKNYMSQNDDNMWPFSASLHFLVKIWSIQALKKYWTYCWLRRQILHDLWAPNKVTNIVVRSCAYLELHSTPRKVCRHVSCLQQFENTCFSRKEVCFILFPD